MIPFDGKLTWLARAALAAAIVVCCLGTVGHATAQDSIQPDKTDLFPDAMFAYRLGNYYLVKGDYERAIESLSGAIALLPPAVFLLDTGYADIYWLLGEAFEGSGRYGEALTSYQYFISLAGEQAPAWTVEKVVLLAARYGALAALPDRT